MKKKNFRIGFRHPFPVLPNIAIFVISVRETTGNQLIDLASKAKELLALEDETTVANYFVCEFRLDK